jgi:hypothetical protein
MFGENKRLAETMETIVWDGHRYPGIVSSIGTLDIVTMCASGLIEHFV